MRQGTDGSGVLRLLALLALLALLLGVGSGAWAQEVREEGSFGLGSSYRDMKREAEEQGFAGFPDVREGGAGTIARLSFDRNNADVSFFTPNTVSADALLTTAKTVAQEMGLPQSDFITVDTKRLRYVDMEMNDYLQKVSRSETRFDFDLSRLRTVLEKSDLPRPIVLNIEPDSDLVTLTEGAGARRLTRATFLRLEDVKPNSQLRWRAVVTPLMWAGAAFWGAMFLLPTPMPWWAAYRRRKQREKEQREGAPVSATPDPAKVQEDYDKQKPQWAQHLGLAALMVAVPVAMLLGKNFLPKEHIKEFLAGINLLPAGSNPFALMPLMMAPLAVSAGLCFWVEKWRERREKAAGMAPPPDPDAEHTVPTWFAMLPFSVMPLMFLLMPVMFIPAVSKAIGVATGGLGRESRFLVIWAFLMLPLLVGMPLLGWYVRKKTRQDLRPGDFWYDQVQAMAREAGVRVRHVCITRSTSRNASATVLGTVTMTSKLLADLEPDEVRAILAHEIGHHKASHPLRGLVLSLVVTLVLVGGWLSARLWIEKRYTLSTEAKVLLRMPIFVVVVLPVLRNLLTGKASRQHEFEADRFAVQVTGDPELVIRALRKIHTLDAQPHLLKKSDEMMQDHPSLANRVEAIRRDAEAANATL